MKRFLLLVIFAMVCMTASPVQAARGKKYVAGNLGFGILVDGADVLSEISFDSGWGFIVAAGYDTGKIRLEGEISYRPYDIDKIKVTGVGTIPVEGDFSALSYMANGYYDIKVRRSPLRPYVGLGFGITHVDIEIQGQFSEGSTEMAYQAMLGLGYRVSRKAVLTAGYRFFGYTDNDGNVVHELNIGARYMF